MRFIIFLIFTFFITWTVAGAQSFQGGLVPEIVFRYKWTDKIQHITKVESMHEFYQNKPQMWNYVYDQTDIQTFVQFRLNPFWKVAGGYQYRLEGAGENTHRAIQQSAFVQKRTGFRFGHRWRTDQSFYPSDATKWRIRYRLSAEIPLQGQSLDTGEYFLVLSGEPIYALQEGLHDLESRLSSSLGYFANRNNNLEIGLDYRLENLLGSNIHHKLWLKFGWFYML